MSSNMSTGQVLGTVVGAVAGYFTFGASYVALGASLGGMIGGALDPLKPPPGPKIIGPRLSDLSQQGSSYGAPIPRIYGRAAVMGNVFWIENNQLKETSRTEKTETSSGGKGGGGSKTTSETTTYTYSATFALGLCEGPITGVRRIWVSGKMIYDAGSDDLGTVMASNAAELGFRLYTGTESQTADPRMQANLGAGNTPAYRGLAYLVFEDFELAEYGNTLMGAQFKVEIIVAGEISMYHGSTLTVPAGGYNSIAALGSIVAASDDDIGIIYSTDGANFYPATILDGKKPGPGMAGNSRIFVASSNNAGILLVSKDGKTWKPITFAGAVYPVGVCWDGYRFMVWTFGTGCFVSKDGDKDWSPITNSNFDGSRVNAFMAITNGYGSTIAYDYHGDNRYSLYEPGDSCQYGYFPYALNCGCWFPGGWIIAGQGSNQHAISTDGLTWTSISVPMEFSKSITWDGEYLYSNYGSQSYYSPDGYNWTIVTGYSSPDYLRYSVFNGAFIYIASAGGYFARIAIRKIVASGVALSSIIESECVSHGLLSPSDIDTSSLTDVVSGYTIASTAAIRSNIEPLQGAWPFDIVQSGYQVKFKRRGGSSLITIPASDLGAGADGDAPATRFVESREMATQLPARVNISYMDAGREYDIGEQYAERINTGSINVRSIEMPLVMTADEAAQKAEILIYLYWLERYDINFVLPPSYTALEPADIVTAQAESGTYELRLTDVNYLSNGLVECSAKMNNAAGYTSAASSDTGTLPDGTIDATVPSVYAMLDVPLMLDDFDTAGFPCAMAGVSGGWSGGSIFRTADGGQTWSLMNSFTRQSVIGICTNALSSPAEHRMIDKSGSLNVNLYGAETLSSITEAQMLNGANHFAYGQDGRWEIISAQNCTLESNGSYTLTDLLRGRYGSEWAMSSHSSGDTLVMLDINRMQFSSFNLNMIGLALDYRGITAGKTIDSDSNLGFTYTGVNLECLSPVYLNGNRHPGTNDWSLDWVRRTRVGGDWRDNVDATLGEASEAYEVEIYSSGTYATLKRTITGLTTPAAAYSSANQVTDFGSNQATLYVKIYQLSANVGRGYPLTQAITR